MTSSPFARWLDSPLLDDGIFAAAYDAVTAQQRACCKTLIARLHACLGEETLQDDTRYLSLRQGFKLAALRQPAQWALVLWDAQCPSPARILAALMPAILAGVPHILACQVATGGAGAVPPPVLAALELAGQETAASIDAQETMRLLNTLAATKEPGRIALLGSAPWVAEALAVARDHAIPAWSAAPPRIALCPSAFVAPPEHKDNANFCAPDYGMLRFAQPDAELVVLSEAKAEKKQEYSCVISGLPRLKYWLSHSPLVLTPGHEWFWRWPDLDREFFMERRYGVAE